MDETTWFTLVLWIILMLAGYKMKKGVLLGSSALLGMYLGLTLATETSWLGLIFIFLNIFIMYSALFREEK